MISEKDMKELRELCKKNTDFLLPLISKDIDGLRTGTMATFSAGSGTGKSEYKYTKGE